MTHGCLIMEPASVLVLGEGQRGVPPKDKRRQDIVQLVDSRGSISFRELRERFPNLSEVTLRSDLKSLDAEHKLVRTYGGARSISFLIGIDLPMSKRMAQKADAKRAIATKAVALISDNATLFVDSGSTTTAFAHEMPDSRHTVFTASISCATELARLQNVTTLMPGGKLNQVSMCLDGSCTIDCIRSLRFEQLFLGATGYMEGTGFTCELEEQAHLKRACIKRSEEVILLIDSSKIDRWGTFVICGLEDIDVIVSDDDVPRQFLASCKAAGVKVI